MNRRIMFHRCLCKRFKSNSSNDREGNVETIIRKKRENKLLYGELLESSTAKRKRLEKLFSNDERINLDPINFSDEKSKKSFVEAMPTDVECKLNELKKDHEPPGKTVRRFVNTCIPTDIIPHLGADNTPTSQPADSIQDVVTKNSLLSFPLFNLKKFKYVVNSTSEEKRIGKLSNHYPDYPSVSEILNKSMTFQSEANLERWKTNMISKLGAEEFKAFNKNQMSRGSLFRNKILNCLNGMSEEEVKIDDDFKGYWSSAKAAFPVIQNIVDSGGLVAHSELKYKGVFDCLSVFRNEVVLVSWKKSEKYIPSLERTYDIPLQIAAYMGALNSDDRYPFRVEKALLIMAYKNGSKADLFYLSEEKCEFYWKQWLDRLNTYCERIHEKGERKKKEVPEETQVSGERNIAPGKIDINDELKKIFAQNQLTPRIIKESDEIEDKMNEFISMHPLINPAKPDYDPNLKLRIQDSTEYEHETHTSVSTILSETKSETAKYILEKWKKMMVEKLGKEGFEKYERETLQTGSTLHEYLNIRFTKGLESLPEIPKNIEGFWRSLSSVFPLITNVHVTESKVAHPICKYRGIIDCIGFFQDKLVVIDWKTSEKLKTSVSKTYDAPLQIVAYIGALNFDPSYPFKVEEGLVVVAYNNGTKANVFHLDKEKCLKYWKKWLKRVIKYQTTAYENGTKIQY